MGIAVLALDLERTLVDDARSARPRPGLAAFLSFCDAHFARVAIFTTVAEDDARDVLESLARQGHVPPGLFARLEFVDWHGAFKDLRFVPDAAADAILLVDDDAGWIRPDQRDQWLAISPWDGGPDGELTRVRAELERRLAGGVGSPG